MTFDIRQPGSDRLVALRPVQRPRGNVALICQLAAAGIGYTAVANNGVAGSLEVVVEYTGGKHDSAHLRIDLRLSGLREIPPEVFAMTDVEELDLSFNQLTSIPPEIGRLTKLRALDVYANNLVTLPSEIGQLSDLYHLDAHANDIARLPRELAHLTELRVLGLRNNNLDSLPDELCALRALEVIDLGHNRFRTVPVQLAENPRLRLVNLADNLMTTVPGGTRLLLERGVLLRLEGNPLEAPIPELLESGPDHLVTYLRRLSQDDGVVEHEAKLLLVGEGNVGKTSVVAALRNAPFVERRPTTHGTDVQPLRFGHPWSGGEMIMHTWDFGGQSEYRITHQFFFSKDALYLVVWYPRDGPDQDHVEYWLSMIKRHVGTNARVIVVATHSEERTPDLDYGRLKREFPEILCGNLAVDSLSRAGFDQLERAIPEQAAQLGPMGQRMPKSWADARDAILGLAADHMQISYTRFVEICGDHQLDDSDAIALARLLNERGQIIYYSDEHGLSDIVVLNPEWLTKAISYVLDDARTKSDGGVLEHARLAAIWQHRTEEPRYPARYHPYFLRLMEKFDVCYRLDDEQDRSLVAQLVPYDRPELPWQHGSPLADGKRSLALKCILAEPALGLISWLTVRNHHASIGKYWRRGVFLRHPIAAYGSEALIELRSDRELRLEVRAQVPELFFNGLRESLEYLLCTRWMALPYELFVPCPGTRSNGRPCDGDFPLAGLVAWRAKEETECKCMRCVGKYDISVLLTGFGRPPMDLQPELEHLHDRLHDMAGATAEIALAVRWVMKVVSIEIRDCPHLFSIRRTDNGRLHPRRLFQERYSLVLWCEQPGEMHSCETANYPLDVAKEWFVRIGPYLSLVFNMLRLVVPIAGDVAKIALPDDQLKKMEDDIDLMKDLVDKLPKTTIHNTWEGEDDGMTFAQGSAHRELRQFLFHADEHRTFGGLRPVVTASADHIWVCAEHYRDYNPGLPNIPAVQ